MDPSHSKIEPHVLGRGEVICPDDADRALNALKAGCGGPSDVLSFHDFAVSQRISRYTDENRAVWRAIASKRLLEITNSGCVALRSGLRALDIRPDQIPDLAALNQITRACAGWQVIGVPMALSPYLYARFLSERVCPIVVGIRSPDNPLIGDAEEIPTFCLSPVDNDLCSEILAIPGMLLNSTYTDFLQRWGALVTRTFESESGDLLQARDHLVSLFDMTVCRGVIQEYGGDYFYGAQFATGELVTPISRYFHDILSIEAVTNRSTNGDRGRVSVIENFIELSSMIDAIEDMHPRLRQ